MTQQQKRIALLCLGVLGVMVFAVCMGFLAAPPLKDTILQWSTVWFLVALGSLALLVASIKGIVENASNGNGRKQRR